MKKGRTVPYLAGDFGRVFASAEIYFFPVLFAVCIGE